MGGGEGGKGGSWREGAIFHFKGWWFCARLPLGKAAPVPVVRGPCLHTEAVDGHICWWGRGGLSIRFQIPIAGTNSGRSVAQSMCCLHRCTDKLMILQRTPPSVPFWKYVQMLFILYPHPPPPPISASAIFTAGGARIESPRWAGLNKDEMLPIRGEPSPVRNNCLESRTGGRDQANSVGVTLPWPWNLPAVVHCNRRSHGLHSLVTGTGGGRPYIGGVAAESMLRQYLLWGNVLKTKIGNSFRWLGFTVEANWENYKAVPV